MRIIKFLPEIDENLDLSENPMSVVSKETWVSSVNVGNLKLWDR